MKVPPESGISVDTGPVSGGNTVSAAQLPRLLMSKKPVQMHRVRAIGQFTQRQRTVSPTV
jgi:hypothetical protein